MLSRTLLVRLVLPALLLLPLLLSPTSLALSLAAQASQSTPLHRLTDPVPDPQQLGVQWFASTGHTLRGAFLAYWTRYGGLAQFGYPLTEEFTESNDPEGKNPLLVQYFERNRFEYHPENAGSPYEVLLGTLGYAFHAADPPVPVPTDPAIRYFPETGHTLAGAFLQYWDTHGGLFVHGYPLTEPFAEVNPTDGKTYTVQYFERSRFELHPENAGSPYEVLLGLLGEQSAQRQGYFDGWYPKYGRAADLSWIAGGFAPARMCAPPPCSCPLFYYGEALTYVEPIGAGWDAAEAAGLLHYKKNGFIVLFGYMDTSNGTVAYGCPTGYFVQYAQANPPQ